MSRCESRPRVVASSAFAVAAPAIGLITAAASALLAVRWIVRYLETRSLAGFGYYRLAAAVVASGLLLTGAV